MDYKIDFKWDDEAGVWIATSDDIPGLVLESGSYDALLERVKIAAAELLSMNEAYNNKEVLLRFHSDRKEKVLMYG